MKKMPAIMIGLSLVMLLTGGLAMADKNVVINVMTPSPPQWQAIPGAPGVSFAPNIQHHDVFRYGGGYYCHQGGNWFQSKAMSGPWLAAPRPPQVFYNIEAPYFKTPPGWAKGKKKGWGDAHMPPGQAKKHGGHHIPPGQAKKMHGQQGY